jgi:hypothetical protein
LLIDVLALGGYGANNPGFAIKKLNEWQCDNQARPQGTGDRRPPNRAPPAIRVV